MKIANKNQINKIKQFGFYTKGFVYSLIGVLAAMVAVGLGGDLKGPTGLIGFLGGLPGGKIITAIVALGLFAYSLWRLYAAVFDPKGDDESLKKRLRIRIVNAYSGLFYALIAFSFAKAVFVKQVSEDGNSEKEALNHILEKEWGVWLIWVLAVAMAGNALWQIYLGISGKYMLQVDDQPDGEKETIVLKRSGRFGYMARGVVFGVLSFFMIKVGLLQNEHAYKGTGGAFKYLLNLNYGPFLMGIVALGMLGYGMFCMIAARNANISKLN